MSSFFTRQLLSWHKKNPRPLPWADHDLRDPYQIWISEVIMQQTRIEQGTPYYQRFIDAFPDFYALASAGLDEVLRAWQGLGYYTRARNLHKAARYIVNELGGNFPNTYEGLLELPGIGHYSAAAIASFAYGLPHPVVDGNVKRLIARFDGIKKPVDVTTTHNLIRERTAFYLNGESPAVFNQAIMNFGALVCRPKNPDCSHCPLKKNCFAFQHSLVNTIPVKTQAKPQRSRYFHFLVLHHRHTILFEQRDQKDIWHGLFILPYIESRSIRKPTGRLLDQKIFSVAGKIPSRFQFATDVRSQTLSHQIIHARFYHFLLNGKPIAATKNQYWASKASIDNLAKPKIIVEWLMEDGFIVTKE